jgi:aminoglycoside phosphotransferase (APT) family kinase protein
MSEKPHVSDSDPEDDRVSDSSTLVYDHEPYDTFQRCVLALCKSLFDHAENDIGIQRLKGGGHNRVIGISLGATDKDKVEEYVLRVPRYEDAQLRRDIAPLQFLSDEPEFKIPQVITFDDSANNPVGSPYMVQRRIPGLTLLWTYTSLSHETKCAIARELGQTFKALHSIKSSTAGTLELSPQGILMVKPFETDGDQTLPHNDGVPTTEPSDMLRELYQKREDITMATLHFSEFVPIIELASEMKAFKLLDDDFYSLCHFDLHPRNILVQEVSSIQQHAITGILDWDSAIFAPPWASCTPPSWLWAWQDDGDEDERHANDKPQTVEMREIKQTFEEAAGPKVCHYAYEPHYRIARETLKLAVDGLRSNETIRAAKRLVEEWAELKNSLTDV